MPQANSKKYCQAADYVEALIRDGRLRPGDRLPSDRALSAKLGLTTVTVSKGINLLVDRGLVERKVGSGSFVADLQAKIKVSEGKGGVLLGMLVHACSDAYAMMVVKAVNEAAVAQGAKLRTSSADGFGDDALRAAKALAEDGCSALIVPWIPYRNWVELPRFAKLCPLPFTLPTIVPGLERNSIVPESVLGLGTVLGMKAACEYFHMLGERRIVLAGPKTDGDLAMRDNQLAYSEFAFRRGLEKLSFLIGPEVKDMDELSKRLSVFKGELALLCYDDLFAVRFMTSMRKLGFEAPRDFRILSWNDSPMAAFADPPLTSIRPDYSFIGEIMIKCAIAKARGEDWNCSEVTPNALVVRSSCGGAGRVDASVERALRSLNLLLIKNFSSSPVEERA